MASEYTFQNASRHCFPEIVSFIFTLTETDFRFRLKMRKTRQRNIAMTDRELANLALEAASTSHSPYSRFPVGAALRTAKGVFQGTNVENKSYGLTVCAERVAVFKAVSTGERRFLTLAVASPTGEFLMPCGACLQVLSEFCENLTIILVQNEGKVRRTSLRKLYPMPFRLKNEAL